MSKTAFLISSVLLCASCADRVSPAADAPLEFALRFGVELDGWQAGFADYPAGSEQFYELSAGPASVPAPLDPLTGFRVSGNNHSDDLFMFIKKKLTAWRPIAAINSTSKLPSQPTRLAAAWVSAARRGRALR